MLDHAHECRPAHGFGARVGIAHIDAAPHPDLADIAHDLFLAEARLAHPLAIDVDAPTGGLVALGIEQDRPALASVTDDRVLARCRPVDLRMRLGVGTRTKDRHSQIPELSPVLERLLGPGPAHDLLGFLEALLRLVGIEPIALIFVDVEERAAAEA